MLCEKTERQLEEVYHSRKPYLNCERFCGIENHDYSECRDFACFKNWLGLEYLDWFNGY